MNNWPEENTAEPLKGYKNRVHRTSIIPHIETNQGLTEINGSN